MRANRPSKVDRQARNVVEARPFVEPSAGARPGVLRGCVGLAVEKSRQVAGSVESGHEGECEASSAYVAAVDPPAGRIGTSE